MWKCLNFNSSFPLFLLLLADLEGNASAASQQTFSKQILSKFGIFATRIREVESGVADPSIGLSPEQQINRQLVNTLLPPSQEDASTRALANIAVSVNCNLAQMKATCGDGGQGVAAEAAWHTLMLSPDQIDPQRTYVIMSVKLRTNQINECIFNTQGKLLEKHGGVEFEAGRGHETERPGNSLSASTPYKCSGSSVGNITDDCIHLNRLPGLMVCLYTHRNITLYYLDHNEPHQAMCYVGRHLPDEEANDCSYIVSGFRHWLEKTAMIGKSESLGVGGNRNSGNRLDELKVHFGYLNFNAGYSSFDHRITLGRDTASFCRCPDLVMHELFHAFFFSKISPAVISWEGRLLTEMISDIGGIALAMRLFPDRYVGGLAASNEWHLGHKCTSKSSIRHRDIKAPNLAAGYHTNYKDFVKSVLANFSRGLSFSDPLTFSGAAYKGSTILSHVFYDLAASRTKHYVDRIFYTWLMTAVSHFHERISLPEVACKLAETTDRIHAEFSSRLRRKLSEAGFDISYANCGTFPRKDCEIVAAVDRSSGVKEVRYEGDYRAFTLCHNGQVFESSCSNEKKWLPEITTETCDSFGKGTTAPGPDQCPPQQPTTCTPPSPPLNGQVKQLNAKIWQFECDSGFKLRAGLKEFVGCVEDGGETSICDQKPCVRPAAPENGLTVHAGNDVYIIICNKGYERIGKRVVNCREEMQQPATCRLMATTPQPLTCPPLPPPPICTPPSPPLNGQVKTYNIKVWQFECDSGYKLRDGSKEFVGCEEDGGETPICETTCNAPPAPEDGFVSPYYNHKEWFEFSCREGFELIGEKVVNCRSQERPTCRQRQTSTTTTSTVSTTTSQTTTTSSSFIPDSTFPLDCQWYRRHRADTTKPAGWTDDRRYYESGCRGGNLTAVKEMVAKWGDRIVDMGRYLVEEKGANVNVGRGDDWKPIHQASYHGQLEMAKYLVAKGAKINTIWKVEMKDDGGCEAGGGSRTPLDMAIRWNKKDTADYFIGLGGRCHCLVTKGCYWYQSSYGLGWRHCPQ